MRPTVSEQLSGISRLLADVVGPEVLDPYASDVLAGAVPTLELLADGWARVAPFLRWDIEATGRVLALAGVDRPPPPEDPLDIEALYECDRRARRLLSEAMAAVMERPQAREAAVALFRTRADRYPIAARPQPRSGGEPSC